MNVLSVKRWLLFLVGVILAILLVASTRLRLSALSTRNHLLNSGQVKTIQTSLNALADSGDLIFLPVVNWHGGTSVEADFKVNGQGKNVDSIAFWEAPNAAETLMFVTAKDNQLVEVWRYPFVGNELPPLQHASFGSSAQVNGVVVDQGRDRLYISVSAPKSTVSVFSLPNRTFIDAFIDGAVNLQSEPNLTLLEHANGQSWLYVSSETMVYIRNALTGTAIGQFKPAKGLETMVADNVHQTIYIPDENEGTGIYAYRPDGTSFNTSGTNNFGSSPFADDAEGIILYTCPSNGSQDDGSGFIVVAEQRQVLTDFEFFDRQTRAHLATLNIAGVSNTDGIASTQRSLPGYPLGVLAVVDDDTSVAGVGWDVILNALGLGCSSSAATAAPKATSTCHAASSP